MWEGSIFFPFNVTPIGVILQKHRLCGVREVRISDGPVDCLVAAIGSWIRSRLTSKNGWVSEMLTLSYEYSKSDEIG